MIRNSREIVSTIAEAFEAGFNVPKNYFEKQYREIAPELAEKEIVEVGPLRFIKPQGIDFNYTLFWTGKKFRGGYITVMNNYSGVGRGFFEENGRTMKAEHIKDLKRPIKKIVGEDPGWVSINFVYDFNVEKFYFWGHERASRSFEMIEKLTEMTVEDLVEVFINDKKMAKPEGFVAEHKTRKESGEMMVVTSSREKSITAAWKDLNDRLEGLKREWYYTPGLDAYMRKGFGKLFAYNDRHNPVDKNSTGDRILENVEGRVTA